MSRLCSMKLRSETISRVLAVFATIVALSASAAPTTAKLPTTLCQLPDVARPARCGVLDVLEDPDQPDGRRLPIHVAVIPAAPGRALSDPIVVLMGGPGEAATLPWTIHRAFAGDWAPIVDGILSGARDRGKDISLG